MALCFFFLSISIQMAIAQRMQVSGVVTGANQLALTRCQHWLIKRKPPVGPITISMAPFRYQWKSEVLFLYFRILDIFPRKCKAEANLCK